jgi:hypothetical protein
MVLCATVYSSQRESCFYFCGSTSFNTVKSLHNLLLLMSPVNHKFELGIKYEEEGRREGPPAYGRAPAKAGEMNKKGLMSPVNRKFEYGIKYEEEGRREGPPAYGRAAAKAGTEFAAARAEAGTEAGLHPLQQELLRPPHPRKIT